MRPLRTAVVATLFAAVLWAPAFLEPMATGFGDWQMVHHNLEAALAAIRAGEAPLWDPYHCGGVTSFGNPESQHFAPWVLFFALAFGSTLATKLLLVVHAAVGAAGAFYYARRRHALGVAPSCLVAGAWAGSGFFSWQMAGGHFTFAPYYLLPWLLLAWRRSLSDLRYVAPVALLLAAMVFEGGTYPVPHALLAMGLEALLALAPSARFEPGSQVRPPLRRALVHIAIAGGLAALLSAARWLPILHTLELFPRSVQSTDTPSLLALMEAWVQSEGEWRAPGRVYVWPEYSAFVGWPVVAAAAVGLPAALRRHRAPLVGLLFFLALAMGAFHPWAPWALLHELPVFDSLRVPSRLQAVITLYLAVLAGVGVESVVRAASARLGHADWWRGVGWGFVPIALAFPVAFNLGNNAKWDGPPVEASDPPAARFHLIGTADYHTRYARLPRENRGTRSCYVGAMEWRPAAGLWHGDRAQARTEAGEITAATRSPNAFRVEVALEREGLLQLNQNYHPDWRASVGEVVDERGRLAVRLPAGSHQVLVRYRPRWLWWGVAASTLGLLAALALLAWSRRRPSRIVLSRPDS